MATTTGTLRNYLVECFAPDLREPALAAVGRDAEAAAAAVRALGRPIEYRGATLVPEDEVVFLHFRAGAADAVQDASAQLSIACGRIVEAIAVRPGIGTQRRDEA